MGSKGIFVWYKLMTDDVEASKRFYTETIGWKTREWGEGDKTYTMWMNGERPVGGLMELPAEAKAMGATPHWMAYIDVADIDAITKKVAVLGGEVMREPFAIDKVGRIAIYKDPQGAVFTVLQPETDRPTPEAPAVPGDFTWNELNTTDGEAAWKFYAALFAWQGTQSMDMGEMGNYQMFKQQGGERSFGGMSNAAKTQGVPPHWLYYTTVDDLDAALERIKARGGKVLNGPMEVPGGEHVAQCQDPQGIHFALHAAK